MARKEGSGELRCTRKLAKGAKDFWDEQDGQHGTHTHTLSLSHTHTGPVMGVASSGELGSHWQTLADPANLPPANLAASLAASPRCEPAWVFVFRPRERCDRRRWGPSNPRACWPCPLVPTRTNGVTGDSGAIGTTGAWPQEPLEPLEPLSSCPVKPVRHVDKSLPSASCLLSPALLFSCSPASFVLAWPW